VVNEKPDECDDPITDAYFGGNVLALVGD